MGQGDPGGQDQAGLGSIVTARKGELVRRSRDRFLVLDAGGLLGACSAQNQRASAGPARVS